ncbi:MAG: BBP7 family outer membrane beta-barrel protein [Pirellulaceae bacterium]|nr:BBP7 family outer membrane beta-barrel protein [Pirellulaceae bacterium]
MTKNIDASRLLTMLLLVAALAMPLLAPQAARAQLYGRELSQPYFDFPNWARFSHCRPGPMAWGYEVFPDYGPTDCACDACDAPPSVACPGDFVAHRPSSWYGTADFAPLFYENSHRSVFARVGPDGPIALSNSDFDPEFDSGGKFTVGKRFAPCWRVEGTYLGSFDYDNASIVTNDDDNTLVPPTAGNLSTFLSGFGDPPTDVLDGANLVSVGFENSFHSAEVNFVYWVDMPPGPFDVTMLVGARYMQINESLNFFSQSNSPAGGSSNDITTATENQLWGVQIGIGGQFLITTRWWFDFTIKGAILNDNIQLNNSITQTIDGVPTTTPTAASANRTAWLGDMALIANWQMTPRLTLRAGYQALFVEGLALAADNMVANGDLLGTNNIRLDNAGDLIYHGPVLGITWMR